MSIPLAIAALASLGIAREISSAKEDRVPLIHRFAAARNSGGLDRVGAALQTGEVITPCDAACKYRKFVEGTEEFVCGAMAGIATASGAPSAGDALCSVHKKINDGILGAVDKISSWF